jgi:hypothetical protein
MQGVRNTTNVTHASFFNTHRSADEFRSQRRALSQEDDSRLAATLSGRNFLVITCFGLGG